MDVLDLHFHFRHALEHRNKDGIHWNSVAHRCMTSLLLLHAAQAWGVVMPNPLGSRGNEEVNMIYVFFIIIIVIISALSVFYILKKDHFNVAK